MNTATFLGALTWRVVVPFPTGPYAQQSVDIATALDLARKNNPDWKSAEQEVEIARGKLTTARLISPFNPVLEGQGGPRRIPRAENGTDYGVDLSTEMILKTARSGNKGDGLVYVSSVDEAIHIRTGKASS
jgi:outer membrane protein TolC